MPALDAVRTGLAALAPVTGRPTPRATPGERTGAATFAAPMTTPPRAPRTSADAPAGPSWADLLARRGEAALNLESSVADVDRTALPDAAPRRDAPSVAQRKAVHRTALDLQDIASNVQRARAVGVEPAKANFWRRFAGAAFTGVLALASAGIAVLSGGAVLAIGAAAVMGVLLVKMSLDTWLAHRVLQNERAVAAGRPEPYHLPMGGDAVGHVLHGLMPDAWAPETRQKIAGALSFGITISLATAAGVLSGGATAVASAVSGSSAALAVGLYAYFATRSDTREAGLTALDGQALDRYMDVGNRLRELRDQAPLWGDIAAAKDAIADLDAEVGTMAEALERNVMTYEQPSIGRQLLLDLVPNVAQAGAAAGQVTGAGVIGNGLRALLVAAQAIAVRAERSERDGMVTAQEEVAAALEARIAAPAGSIRYV